MLNLVNEERSKHPFMGTRKLLVKLQAHLEAASIKLGRDRFFRLLRQAGRLLPRRKRNACRTTDSRHGVRCYDNPLKGLTLSAPHQALVADITYLRTLEGFRYLSLILGKPRMRTRGRLWVTTFRPWHAKDDGGGEFAGTVDGAEASASDGGGTAS